MTVHKVIDDFTPEQLAKLKAMRQAESKSKASAFFRDDELLLAEFGWMAVTVLATTSALWALILRLRG